MIELNYWIQWDLILFMSKTKLHIKEFVTVINYPNSFNFFDIEVFFGENDKVVSRNDQLKF